MDKRVIYKTNIHNQLHRVGEEVASQYGITLHDLTYIVNLHRRDLTIEERRAERHRRLLCKEVIRDLTLMSSVIFTKGVLIKSLGVNSTLASTI